MNTDGVRPPPRNAPRFGFYRHNLRPIVIALAAISALWCLFSAIGFFRAVGEERTGRIQTLVPVSIALGCIYIVVCVIEIFGVYSAYSRKLALVRIYALLSALTTIAILGSGILRIVIHFTKKNDLISQCAEITSKDGIAVYPFGFWGPIYNADFDDDDAERWCTRSWNRGSWSEILATLITSFLAGFWTLIVYSYYRQLLDPSSVANASRVTANTEAYPSHYTPPYNYGYNMPYTGGPAPSQQYGAPGQWAPPAGPPPATYSPPLGAPPPGYTGNGDFAKDKKPDNPFDDFTEVGDSKGPK